jgi:hypothetical protein
MTTTNTLTLTSSEPSRLRRAASTTGTPSKKTARRLCACLFALVAFAAVSARAQGGKPSLPKSGKPLLPKSEEKLDSVLTNAGELSIVRIGEDVDMDMELRLKGRKVYHIEGNMNASFIAQFRTYASGDVVVMSASEGGSACPAQFQIIRVEAEGKVSVTDEFGDCGDSPTISLQLLPDEQVTLRFQGYYRLSEEQEPGFQKPPPTTYVYKQGVLKELKAASPPKRRGK